jgi:DNA topoisomerase-2
MGLVNGYEGIGTGWSTNVPNFNPREIASLIIKKLDNNEPFIEIEPWYKGFIGKIINKPDLSSY